MRTNLQPAEPLASNANRALDVHSIWKTIQGEGPFAGTPAMFIRLAGCNLQCPQCDTDYTTGRRAMDVNEIYNVMTDVNFKDGGRFPGLVVITGGEPFRQDLTHLLQYLMEFTGSVVQVETNGTLAPDLPARLLSYLHIVVSPKYGLNNWYERHGLNHSNNVYFKYVLDANAVDPEDGLPTRVLGITAGRPARPPSWLNVRTHLFVQPLDVGDSTLNKLHQDAAVRVCLEHGYRMCLQTHKLLGLP